MLPAWFTDRGLNDNNSYTTDDIFSFLEDGSGVNTSNDYLFDCSGAHTCHIGCGCEDGC